MTEERNETYSVIEIREAFAEHAGEDSWNVRFFYEDMLISALRGEFDEDPLRCRHRFPDGTRCGLSPEAHREVPWLSEVHHYPPEPRS